MIKAELGQVQYLVPEVQGPWKYLPQVQGTMYLDQKYLVPNQVLCTWYLGQVLCIC